MPIIEFDEMQASQTDMMWTSVVSLVGVFVLFIACYGGLRHSLLANLVLLLATAYSFCFVTLVVGHLNILSAALGAVLIGLGIDFGIHYLACYLKLRGEGYDEEGALLRTSIEVGPGMFTGGVTTAAAFFMAGMTDFVGVRELGLVAGGSLLLCLAATIVILPPLVLVVDRRWPIGAVPNILPAGGWFRFTGRWPRLVMGGCLVLTLLAAAGAGWLRYDHNLLNLQPRHLESADIERQLLTKLEDSVWFAVSLCESREVLLARKARFEQLASVAKTEEIASLLPTASPRRKELVASIHERLSALPQRVPELPAVDPERLGHEIARAQTLLAKDTPYETPAGTLLGQLRGLLAQMPPDVAVQRLSGGQAQLAGQSLAQLTALRNISNPQEPQLADLPQELVDRFVGVRGTFLLKVYARGNVWDMDQLAAFVRDVESIDPQVTGHPVQTCYASQHMQQSYIYTGLYALVAVMVLLWIDLRSLTHSLLAMTPLALGFVQMCGLFGWLGIPFNPANMIVLPVILGIGVDHGVHLVHAWRQQRGRFVMGDSTAVAVLLTATTTTASFGVLILARHQGLQSLGQVLTIGVTTCLFSSIVFFPALLAWLTRNRVDRPAAEPADAAREDASQIASRDVPIVTTAPPALGQFVAIAAAQPLDEQQIIEQVENEVAALVLEASAQAQAKSEPASSPAPIVPRRRPDATPADEDQPTGDSPEQGGRGAGLRHLAGRRQSDR
jgi:hopanoid biosynthesis associated RND transporter like protein HpnN